MRQSENRRNNIQKCLKPVSKAKYGKNTELEILKKYDYHFLLSNFNGTLEIDKFIYEKNQDCPPKGTLLLIDDNFWLFGNKYQEFDRSNICNFVGQIYNENTKF